MIDFNSVVNDAQALSEADQLRLIDALWSAVPADADLPLPQDWSAELQRRVAEIEAGTATTIPWETIRAEALARIGDDSAVWFFRCGCNGLGNAIHRATPPR